MAVIGQRASVFFQTFGDLGLAGFDVAAFFQDVALAGALQARVQLDVGRHEKFLEAELFPAIVRDSMILVQQCIVVHAFAQTENHVPFPLHPFTILQHVLLTSLLEAPTEPEVLHRQLEYTSYFVTTT